MNQLLTELDGAGEPRAPNAHTQMPSYKTDEPPCDCADPRQNVFIIAATNRPVRARLRALSLSLFPSLSPCSLSL